MDNKQFYKKYKQMYPIVHQGVYIHQSPHDNKIISNMTQNELKHVFESSSLLEINNDAVRLLKKCDGCRTIEEITFEFQKILGNPLCEIQESICGFLNKAFFEYHYIDMKENVQEKYEIEFTGSKEFYYPVHFVLEITSKCNLKCKHCYHSFEEESNETELSYEEILKIMDEMYEYGARFIELTGGEVMIHPKAKEIIEYACQKFHFVCVLSNGVLINENLISGLDKYKNSLIWSISLDSFREEFHNEFRGYQNAFEKTTQAIRLLIRHKHLVRIAMSVVEDNFFDIEGTLEFAKNDLHATWFGFNFALPLGRGKNLEWNLDIEATQKRNNEIEKNIREYKQKYPGFLNEYSKDLLEKLNREEGNCGVGWKNIVIGSNGNIRPCVMGDEKYIVMGNILNSNHKYMVESGITNSMFDIKWPLLEECESCENKQFCSRCVLRALTINEERIKQGLDICNWAKKYHIREIFNIDPNNNEKSFNLNCLLRGCSK